MLNALRAAGSWLTSDFRPKPANREWPTPLDCLGGLAFVTVFFGLIAFMGAGAGF